LTNVGAGALRKRERAREVHNLRFRSALLCTHRCVNPGVTVFL
jgi:hypothetical protein